MSDTISQLSSQLANPSDVTTVLMIIGGDVVQKALAQTAGCWYTPVCFSFGWVAYTFMALVGVLGDGRLLPSPDYPVKVFNLRTGYVRDNRNWVIGRLLRDHETYIAKRASAPSAGIRITVWEAKDNIERQSKTSFSYSTIHLWGLATTFTQLAIAAIPLVLDGRWGILLITGAGTLLALIAGGLPQWRAEKLPNRQNSEKTFALTTGNGSKDIMVIIGAGNCLDLEDLSAQETPRSARPWEKFHLDETQHTIRPSWMKPEFTEKSTQRRMRSFHFSTMQLHSMLTKSVRGLPGGFALTMIVCVAQSILWLLLLIVVAALDTDTWYLILVGAIGMFQNGYLAAMERAPEHSNCPLAFQGVITTSKVMDGLMDLEVVYERQVASSYNISEPFMMPLVKEFFPGRLWPDEEDWWRGKRSNYDQSRLNNMELRGFPRSAPLSRKSTAWSEFEQKQPWNALEKGKAIRDGTKYNTFDRFQSVGASSVPRDPGLSSQRDQKVADDFSAQPKSPPQAHHAGLGRLLEHSGENSTEIAHVTPDPPRAAQFRSSNSPSVQAQRLSRPQYEGTPDHGDGGYALPIWS